MIFQAIIFDFDGVIVDSEVVANAALADVLTQAGHAVTAEQAIELYSGLRWTDCHRRIEQESGLVFDREWLGDLVDAAVAARVAEVLAIEGIEPFLASQAHRALAIASSSDKAWLDGSLARLGLASWFGGRVFSAAGFARGKPHPDIYLHAAERLGVDPSACLVIEDHPVGVAAGAAAGMTVIALLAAGHIRGGHAERVRAAGARHVAHDYAEVAAILAEIERG
ncbi:MAG TPA: HAD family phosphatase [Allosphingosinicella sp.]|nr:HAD family phosphatase [Allosphingosinicella sp.]